MVCPRCGASTNDYGIWLGNDTIRCMACKICFNFRTNTGSDSISFFSMLGLEDDQEQRRS